MRRAILPTVVAAVAGLLAIAPVAQANPDTRFGVNVGSLFNKIGLLEPDAGTQLDDIAGAGIGIVRSDAAWAAVEPSPPFLLGIHNYGWDPTDRVAATLARRGLRWLPVLGFAVPWSTTVMGTDKAAPASLDAFASYAAAFANRYGPGGTFWALHPELPQLAVTAVEVWNEANLRIFWRPQPDPGRYAALFVAAANAIHAARPGVAAIVGGLSPYNDPQAFLRAMLADHPDAASRIDGVALHPYARGPVKAVGLVATLRATMRDLGLGATPISVTEFGWPSPNNSPNAGFALPDPTRAGGVALVTDALTASDCGVDRLLPYTWMTAEGDPREQEDWFGITHPGGALSPVRDSYFAAVARDATPAPSTSLGVCGAGTAPPLPIGLGVSHVRRGSRTCLHAAVTYRGLPVHDVVVKFVTTPGGPHRMPITEDDGTVVACLPAGSRVKVNVVLPSWAKTNTVRAVA